MQIKCHKTTLLCFYVLLQLVIAYQKNDYLKNNPRYYQKKYLSTTKSPRSLEKHSSNSPKADTNIRLRHSSSKFPKFDRLKTRLAALSDDSDSGASDSHTSNSRYFSDNRINSDIRYSSDIHGVPRLRHHGWMDRARTSTSTSTTASPDEELFNTYGDLEDDYKTEDDYNYEDTFFDSLDEDEENEFQAEEPTERPTPAPERQMSSLSEFKWRQYGTREGVMDARRKQLNIHKTSEENKSTAVVEHYRRVISSGECKNPIPKVIPVQLEHPNTAVTYIPHCTVLHRCAEDTGCCKYDATCKYKSRVEVNLYFYVKPVGSDHSKVEKLTFYNHTECECSENSKKNKATTERQKGTEMTSVDTVNSKISLKSGSNSVPENIQVKCNCPEEFSPKIRYYTKCFCDCKQDNQDCIRMKKGKEYIGLKDRLCILNSQCGIVECEYGPYIKEKGRCPRKNEY